MPPKGSGISPQRKKAKSNSKTPAKKLSSLSSFQPMLSFARSSSSSSTVPAPKRRSTDNESERMPPPALPTKLGATKSAPALTADKGKGKAKKADEVEVVEIIDSDDEDTPPVRRKRGLESTVSIAAAMWTELYGPTTEAELAPGKARVTKVREWLHEAVYGMSEAARSSRHPPPPAARERSRKYKRVLLVTGPAGIGKTTTVRLLAAEMGIELVEWSDTVEERSLGGGFEHESAISKLSGFLSRHAYPALSMASGSSSATPQRPRTLLMTSLPNIGHLPTRAAFHEALQSFCKSFSTASCPLIIVHSDAGSGGRAEESWMDRERGGHQGLMEVVGREVKDGPWCTEIDFLPLAHTFLTKAINRVLSLAVDSAHRPSAGAVQLIAVSCKGDLRSAINSMQLLCTGDKARFVSSSKKAKAPRVKATGRGSRGGKGATIDVSEDIRATLDAVSRREQSLGLFHALGKVFYNKRLGDPATDHDDQEDIETIKRIPTPDPLPSHLHEFERRTSMVQMETFIPTIPIDASTFALWVHHNVSSFTTDIDQMSLLLDDFCAADLMRTDDDIWQSSPQAIAYALHMTVRGTLMALPSPVPRKSQKVVKPQFFESYRTERENASVLDAAAGFLAKRAVTASVALADGTVEEEDGVPWGGMPTQTVLAGEMVPMVLKIQQAARRQLLPASASGLLLNPSGSWPGFELTERDEAEDDGVDAELAGEDGMGSVAGEAWVPMDVDEAPERTVGWLEEDDIEDWD